MKRFLAGLCAVTLLFVSSTSLKAQEGEENAAADEFKSLIEEIYELRESDKLSRTEWSKIRAALSRLSRKLQDKSTEERAELYNSTGDYLIELLESAEKDGDAAEAREKAIQQEQRAVEKQLRQRERAMAQQAQQRAAELEQQARAIELRARDMERAVRQQVEAQSNLARELAEAKRAAEQDDDDDEEGDHGIQMDLEIDGKRIQIEGDNLNNAVRELLQELEGVDEVGGRLEALMELNSGKLEEWAEEHSQKWEAWAKDFEKAAESFEHELEHWAEEEMEEWAEEYSQKWEKWAEKLEAQGLEHDDLAELLESNMEMIGDLPIKEIYGRAMEKLEDSDLFSEEKMDELGDMIRDSVEQALEAIEEDEDVAELLNIAGEKGKNLQGTLEKLLENTDRKKADQMRAAELQALAAERHAEALERAKVMQEAARLAAEQADARTSEMHDRLEADRRKLTEQHRLAELEQLLQVERAKRTDMERLLQEQQKLQERNSEVEELRAQMEALRAQLEQLRRNRDRDNDFDDDDDDVRYENSFTVAHPFLA